MVDATSQASWDGLLARIAADMPTVVLTPYAEATSEGVRATTPTMRGPAGAYTLHDLACRYGALPVIE